MRLAPFREEWRLLVFLCVASESFGILRAYMLNKARLESLSDGLFSIVFTLLVIEIRVPEVVGHISNAELWHELLDLSPLFIGYGVSFLVLAMFWLSHNFFFHYFVKEINREILLLNLVYLGFVSLVPFSAHLIGRYPELSLAVAIYGVNVLLIGLMNVLIRDYAMRHHDIDTSHVSKRILSQANVRMKLTVGCTLIGIACAFVWIPFALFMYAFPILFNIIPGTLNKLEKMFGFTLGE